MIKEHFPGFTALHDSSMSPQQQYTRAVEIAEYLKENSPDGLYMVGNDWGGSREAKRFLPFLDDVDLPYQFLTLEQGVIIHPPGVYDNEAEYREIRRLMIPDLSQDDEGHYWFKVGEDHEFYPMNVRPKENILETYPTVLFWDDWATSGISFVGGELYLLDLGNKDILPFEILYTGSVRDMRNVTHLPIMRDINEEAFGGNKHFLEIQCPEALTPSDSDNHFSIKTPADREQFLSRIAYDHPFMTDQRMRTIQDMQHPPAVDARIPVDSPLKKHTSRRFWFW